MGNKREWLIQIREARNLTRTDMVERLKITQQAYNYIENNNRNPSVELAQKIADILDFDWTMFYPKKKKK